MSSAKPDYERGNVRLYCADCLDVLPELDHANHIITDPPYEAEAHAMQLRAKRGSGLYRAEPLPFDSIDDETRDLFGQFAFNVCDGWLLVFCQAEAVATWREALTRGGAKYRRAMVWIKPDGMPQYSGDRPGMGYESIVASWCGHSGSKWNGGGRHGVFTCSKGHWPNGAPHPTTKPLTLMLDLVRLFSDPGETILDPFMGSGTTGVAAVKLGRGFVGIERERKYFDVAVSRIDAAFDETGLLDYAEAAQQADLSLQGDANG